MIFFWRGYGLIVPLLLTAGTYSLIKLFGSFASTSIRTLMFLSLTIIGILLWYLGRRLIQNDSTERKGNQKINKEKYDVFCSISIKHWGIIIILLSIIIAVI